MCKHAEAILFAAHSPHARVLPIPCLSVTLHSKERILRRAVHPSFFSVPSITQAYRLRSCALRAANRFRVRRHTCDPSQGDEEVWLHGKIMAACTGKGAVPENREGVEQGPESWEDVVQEAGSTPVHATQAPIDEGHAGSARAAHPSQPTKPDTRRGPNAKGSSRQPAQYADCAAAVQLSDHAVAPPPDRLEAGSKPGQPSSGGADTAVDGADKAAAEEEHRLQELSRGGAANGHFCVCASLQGEMGRRWNECPCSGVASSGSRS